MSVRHDRTIRFEHEYARGEFILGFIRTQGFEKGEFSVVDGRQTIRKPMSRADVLQLSEFFDHVLTNWSDR